MDALTLALFGCLAIAFVCWLVSVLTHEYSWVDRLWSITPPLYVGFFAWSAGAFDARLAIMTVLAGLWGARLTFNFARKGGYAKGGEDYRWAELRTRMSAAQFQVFNVLFVALFQHVLLLAIALPAWVALEHHGAPLGPLDAVATLLFLALLAFETLADEQQWRFQNAKKAARARGETVATGFLTTGLFRFSRHPNFFCEQSMWWVFYLFGVAAGGAPAHWTLAGAVVLSGLFHGSTNFTEELSLRKYPSYSDYQRKTSRLLPLPPRA